MLQKPHPPYVFIAGAGPGDPALLTVKTYELITKIADIVIYDRLIPNEIISLIPKHIEVVYAGKSCRKHHMTQEEINIFLVEKARENKIVVRLKGGDPFIFGRGGEEALYLFENNIDFEIVPGVNAADGCAAYRGIPLTHRGLASSVRFITGHKQKGQAIKHHWRCLADEDTTLVVYMGLANIEEIATNLIKNGLASDTLAAAIEQGTTNEEKFLVTSLDNLCDKLKEQQFAPPTLIIIGKVVKLAKTVRKV